MLPLVITTRTYTIEFSCVFVRVQECLWLRAVDAKMKSASKAPRTLVTSSSGMKSLTEFASALFLASAASALSRSFLDLFTAFTSSCASSSPASSPGGGRTMNVVGVMTTRRGCQWWS